MATAGEHTAVMQHTNIMDMFASNACSPTLGLTTLKYRLLNMPNSETERKSLSDILITGIYFNFSHCGMNKEQYFY